MGPRKRARRHPAEGGSAESSPMTSQVSGLSDKTTTTAGQGAATTSSTADTASASTATIANSSKPSVLVSQPDSVDNTASKATPSPNPQPKSAAPIGISRLVEDKEASKPAGWYGSWPRTPKSAASIQLARETIQGGTLKPASTPDFRRFEAKRPSDLSSLDGANQSAVTLPNLLENRAEQTGKDVEMTSPPAQNDSAPKAPKEEPLKGAAPKDDGSKPIQSDATPSADPARESQIAPAAPSTPSSWRGWFGKTPGPESSSSALSRPSSQPVPKQVTPEVASKEAAVPPTQQAEEQPAEAKTTENTASTAEKPQPVQSTVPDKPWYSFWGQPAATPIPGIATPETPATSSKDNGAGPKEPEDVVMEDAPPAPADPAQTVSRPSAGSTWAFWSKDSGPKSPGEQAPQPEHGQIAVMGESSESQPKPADAIEVSETTGKETPVKPPATAKGTAPKGTVSKDAETKDLSVNRSSSKKNKRHRPQSMEIDEQTPSRPSTPKTDTVIKPPESGAKPGSSKAAATPPPPAKPPPPNLLLPQFRSTYRLKENPSILRQIAQLLLRTQQPPARHVFLAGPSEVPKVKRALAIGVHGLFPAAYLRAMIGQPTGTSLKFANHCAEAIRRWGDAHGCGDSLEIEKVALEGEGRIAERVENLWKLLLNWIDQIRRADLIVLGCHSQGVPVGIMLLAKLIELGVITSARIGVCAMAGVSLGPFPDYKSGMGMLMGAAAELWEFSNPESEVSKRYESSLRVVLSYGVRVTFIGSIDDQLVPIESAVYSPAQHPYIYRAVFIDGRIHAPDFIAHLVGFALKLRNLGVSDHGLVRELSIPLAGSLYGGEGHSRLYDDPQVYDLAVAHALETADVSDGLAAAAGAGPGAGSGKTAPDVFEVRKHAGFSNPNPYHLPWIMRGLLEEDFVKTELSAETAELLRQFDDWKPVTKALKDVKYRLEAVRLKM